MGRKPWEHKRDAKIAARLRVAGDASDTNKRKEVTEAFSDARRDRHSKDSGSGGFIPSAKHVEGACERYATNAAGHRNNRPSLCIEGTERYDNAGPAANRPLDRYRAPSLRTRVDPVRPAIEPDFGRVGRGAPAVKPRVEHVDAEIARKNAYARRGDYAGEGPALLPLPKIEVVQPYPKPETVRVTVLRGPGLSIVELDGHKAPPKLSFNHAPGRVRALRVRVRVWGHHAKWNPRALSGLHSIEAPAVRRVVWFGHRETRYHPGYDTSAWVHPRSAEELVYRALVML